MNGGTANDLIRMEKLKYEDISTFIFDVDGVLTNSQLHATENGDLLRHMNTRDGYALKRAHKAGYTICIITGGSSKGVHHRLSNIGIKYIYSGIMDKVPTLKKFLEETEIDPDQAIYMGDDLPDLDVMKIIGNTACPKDAAHEIKSISNYISPIKGGEGCVRDIIEKIMRIQDKW